MAEESIHSFIELSHGSGSRSWPQTEDEADIGEDAAADSSGGAAAATVHGAGAAQNPSCVTRLLDLLFPFRLLSVAGAARRRQQPAACFAMERHFGRRVARLLETPTMAQVLLMILLGWLFVAGSVTYVMLATSSLTHSWKWQSEEPHWKRVKLMPDVGRHWELAAVVKYSMQTFFLHRLCRDLMISDPQMERSRGVDDEELNETGVLHSFDTWYYWITCRVYRKRWLTAFTMDRLLLAVVGTAYLCAQPALLAIKYDKFVIGMQTRRYLWQQVLSCTAAMYVCVLIKGFLWMTLTNHAKARPRRGASFSVAMIVLMVLVALEFLVLKDQRQHLTSFELRVASGPVFFMIARLLAAVGQVFTTHSLAMLGAVLLGHSSHLHRVPDLTWRTLFTKVLPMALLMVAWTAVVFVGRVGHQFPRCRPLMFEMARLHSWGVAALRVLGGPLLVGLGIHLGRVRVQTSAPSPLEAARAEPALKLASVFDYDTLLLGFTFTLSMFRDLCDIYMFKAERHWTEFVKSAGMTVSGIGMALFVIVAWHMKPTRGWEKAALWFALLLCFVCFLDYQMFEDCETSSALPGCCNFPGVTAREGSELWEVCTVDSRCSEAHSVPVRGSESERQEVYCKLPEHGHGHEHEHDDDDEEGMDGHHHADGALGISVPGARMAREEATCEAFESMEVASEPWCDCVKGRWAKFKAASQWQSLKVNEYDGLLNEENAEEEESFSSAFRVFVAVGTASSVEFYFTAIGVLGKIILAVEHPNSERIMQLNRHDHHH